MRGELLEKLKNNAGKKTSWDPGEIENHEMLAVYMCQGMANYRINEEEILLKEGELLIIGRHALVRKSGNGASSFAVSFSIPENFSERYLDEVSDEESFILDFFMECLSKEQLRISYICFRMADMFPVQNLMENILWMTLDSRESRVSFRKKNVVLLLQYLASMMNEAQIGSDCVDNAMVWKVYTYIEENYRDGELSDLAKILGYKISYLSGEIKKLTGKTYTDLLQKKRMYQAVWLLKYTDLPITDIALDIGYHNFTYFYKLFVAKFGVSPKNYRVSHNRSVLIS